MQESVHFSILIPILNNTNILISHILSVYKITAKPLYYFLWKLMTLNITSTSLCSFSFVRDSFAIPWLSLPGSSVHVWLPGNTEWIAIFSWNGDLVLPSLQANSFIVWASRQSSLFLCISYLNCLIEILSCICLLIIFPLIEF